MRVVNRLNEHFEEKNVLTKKEYETFVKEETGI